MDDGNIVYSFHSYVSQRFCSDNCLTASPLGFEQFKEIYHFCEKAEKPSFTLIFKKHAAYREHILHLYCNKPDYHSGFLPHPNQPCELQIRPLVACSLYCRALHVSDQRPLMLCMILSYINISIIVASALYWIQWHKPDVFLHIHLFPPGFLDIDLLSKI